MKTFVRLISIALCFAILLGCVGCGQTSLGGGANIIKDGKGGVNLKEGVVFELLSSKTAAVKQAAQVDANTSGAVEIARKINDFGYELALLTDEGESFILSPFSLYAAIASLSNGAEGSAYEQIKSAVYPNGMDADSFNEACGDLIAMLVKGSDENTDGTAYELAIASLVVTDNDYTIRDKFAELAVQNFRAETAIADFADPTVKDSVNEWADEATNGLIPQLFGEPIPNDTAMLLLSSLYFSGAWRNEFYESFTAGETFHGVKGDRSVQMMSKNGNQLYYENEMLQATLQSYYGGAQMEIFLPKEGYEVGDILAMLSQEQPEFDYYTADGLLKLPKFKTESSFDLNDAVKALGMTDVYEGGLGGLATGPNELYLSSVLQKAVIEVDEKGTKAAAVTAMIVAATGAFIPSESFEMICDRPFVYTISVNVGGEKQVLFIGAER